MKNMKRMIALGLALVCTLGTITGCGKEKEQDESFDYSDKRKTVNVYKFKKDFFMNALAPVLKKEVAAGNVNSYYELCLREIILSKKWDIRVMNIPESYWCEIDDADDLARAEKSDLL